MGDTKVPGERQRSAVRADASQEERCAERRIGGKTRRAEAVDEGIGEDVDEHRGGESAEQERAHVAPPPQPQSLAQHDRPGFLAAQSAGEERVALLLGLTDLVQEAPQAAPEAEPERDRRGEEAGGHAEEGSIGELIVRAQREPSSGGEEGDRWTEDRSDHEGEGDVGDGPGE